MQIIKLNIILSLVCNSHWLWKKPGSSTPVTFQVLLMPCSKCLAGNQSGHDIILSKPFCPLFKIKKINKNYLIHVCCIRKLVCSHLNFWSNSWNVLNYALKMLMYLFVSWSWHGWPLWGINTPQRGNYILLNNHVT